MQFQLLVMALLLTPAFPKDISYPWMPAMQTFWICIRLETFLHADMRHWHCWREKKVAIFFAISARCTWIFVIQIWFSSKYYFLLTWSLNLWFDTLAEDGPLSTLSLLLKNSVLMCKVTSSWLFIPPLAEVLWFRDLIDRKLKRGSEVLT